MVLYIAGWLLCVSVRDSPGRRWLKRQFRFCNPLCCNEIQDERSPQTFSTVQHTQGNCEEQLWLQKMLKEAEKEIKLFNFQVSAKLNPVPAWKCWVGKVDPAVDLWSPDREREARRENVNCSALQPEFSRSSGILTGIMWKYEFSTEIRKQRTFGGRLLVPNINSGDRVAPPYLSAMK